MSLPTEPVQVLTYLARLHDADRPQLEAYDAYYELEQPLSYMHPEIAQELDGRIRAVLIAWPQLVVDSVEERLDIEGFGLPGADTGDDDLWRVWQANNLDEESQLAHVDALAMRRSYVAVGTNEQDPATPLVTVESPLEMFAHIDPRTRRVDAALRRWCDVDDLARQSGEYATLYLPEQTIWYDRADGGWREIDRDEHGLGVVPVSPITNRARLSSRRARLVGHGRGTTLVAPRLPGGRYGQSDLAAVIPLSDAACKIATDMMLGAEFHAIPLRALFGVGPEDLVDEHGRPMTATKAVMGKLLTLLDTETKAYQFDATSLSNYHETLNQLARLVASISGIPPHYLGFTSDNPASADAIRSAEARLVKRAERKQRAFGGSWEHGMWLVRIFQDRAAAKDPELRRMETKWRDAATPTVAQRADATVKVHAAGIIDTEQAQEDLGYTDGQRAGMRQRRERNQLNLGIGSLEQFANQPPAQPLAGPAPPVPA